MPAGPVAAMPMAGVVAAGATMAEVGDVGGARIAGLVHVVRVAAMK